MSICKLPAVDNATIQLGREAGGMRELLKTVRIFCYYGQPTPITKQLVSNGLFTSLFRRVRSKQASLESFFGTHIQLIIRSRHDAVQRSP
jgi:hypothetical protein